MRTLIYRCGLLATTLLAVGCAAPQYLNDSSRSVLATDTANLLAPRQIPFETKSAADVEVSYNLFFAKSNNLSGYRLTLIFRNRGSSPMRLTPKISLQDAAAFVIPPYDFYAFMSEAAALAGTEVPPIPVAQQSTYYSSGTIRNTSTGTAYNYTSTTRQSSGGGFAAGFAQGVAQGAAIRAANDREQGFLMMRWANSFWLKSAYVLPPGSAVTGAVFLPSPQLGEQPLKLGVGLGGSEVEFVTAPKR